MTNIVSAIYALVPKASFNTSGGKIFWHDNRPQPTEEEIQEKITELQAAEPMRLLRMERDQLLSQSDWRDLPSYPGSNQEAWRTYRQQLRDLPSTTDPSNPTWPTAPEND